MFLVFNCFGWSKTRQTALPGSAGMLLLYNPDKVIFDQNDRSKFHAINLDYQNSSRSMKAVRLLRFIIKVWKQFFKVLFDPVRRSFSFWPSGVSEMRPTQAVSLFWSCQIGQRALVSLRAFNDYNMQIFSCMKRIKRFIKCQPLIPKRSSLKSPTNSFKQTELTVPKHGRWTKWHKIGTQTLQAVFNLAVLRVNTCLNWLAFSGISNREDSTTQRMNGTRKWTFQLVGF